MGSARLEVESADEPPVRFREWLFDLPAEPEVQRQIAAHAPIVVRVERQHAALFGVRRRAAHRSTGGQTDEERGEVLPERSRRGVVERSTRPAVAEIDLRRRGRREAAAILDVVAVLGTELHVVRPDEPHEAAGDRIHVGGEVTIARLRHTEVLEAVVVDERERGDIAGRKRYELRRETERREVEPLAPPALREQLPREPAANVHHQVVAERVGVIHAENTVLPVQEDSRGDVVEAIVFFFLPEIPAEAAVDPMVGRDVVIDPSGGGVVGLERHRRRVLEVLLTIGRGRLVWQRKVLEDSLRDGVDQSGRDDVSGEGIAGEPPRLRRVRPDRERVVDLILRSEREQIREVPDAHLRRRHRHDIRRGDLEGVRLDIREVEGPIRLDGASHGAAEPVVLVVALRPVGALVEEVLRVERGATIPLVHLPPEGVGPALGHEVDHGAHRVANCRVVGGRMDLELLDRRRRRAIRDAVVGDVRDAVDREVVLLLADAVGGEL